MNEATCGCCEGTEKITPQSTANRPGFDALAYRVGTHSTFLETMKASLSGAAFPALRSLTTREAGDPSIAFLDAGATLLDVLTFYQERIANEGYLRTATERRSILELARLVGYKLRPGVAASVFLAFTLEQGYETEIPAGTRAQSIPNPGETIQAFETSEPVLARTAWNYLQLRMTRPIYSTLGSASSLETLYFQGTSTDLKSNDLLLLIYETESGGQVLRRVADVDTEFEADATTVTLLASAIPANGAALEIVDKYLVLENFHVSTGTQMAKYVTGLLLQFKRLVASGLTASDLAFRINQLLSELRERHAIAIEGEYERLEPWVGGMIEELEDVQTSLRMMSAPTERAHASSASGSIDEKDDSQLTGLGRLVAPLLLPPSAQPRNTQRLARNYRALFSTQADTIPRLLTTFQPKLKDSLYEAWANTQVAPKTKLKNVDALRVRTAPFGHNAPKKIQQNDNGVITGYHEWDLNESPFVLALDAEYGEIQPGSWVVVERPVISDVIIEANLQEEQEIETIFRMVTEVRTISRADYGIASKVTQLTLNEEWCAEAIEFRATTSFLRNTTIFTQSETLALVEEPIADDVLGGMIELGILYDGLEPGRWIIVSGERTDIPGTTGVMASELVMIAGIVQGIAQVDIGNGQSIDLPGDKTHTTLKLANALSYTYKRDTVKIYGNVVKATHGETRVEVLGGGDTSQAFQTFVLKQAPLTFVSAPTISGVESTLEVRVNDVRWPEADALAWLDAYERGYETQTNDEAKTSVIFGDGEHGARLPTGPENIKAVYRSGIGKPGNVTAEQISLLATKPLGVKSVINPLRAFGGADREGRDQARRNAPLKVMSLDRLVSVQDYADFARTFAGVGKASATRLTDGRRELVHVTIAGVDDILIDSSADLYLNLQQALHKYGDPFQAVQLATRELKLLIIAARVRLLPDYFWEAVEPQIRASLLDTFSFAQRELGQDVVSSQVLQTIQANPGVAYVDLDILDAVAENSNLADLENLAETLRLKHRIRAEMARLDPDIVRTPRPILPAQLAYLSPEITDTLILSELT